MNDKLDNISQCVWRNPHYFIAFGVGSGLSPIAPGTMGTLAAIPIYLLMVQMPTIFYLIGIIGLYYLGVYVSEKVSIDIGIDDYSGIVIDEIVGFLITMMFIPPTMGNMVLGFVVFRFFDILKPWPISFIERRFKGGVGVMLDDVVAGLFAFVTIMLLIIIIN